jgi:hypothetical protein
MQLAAWFGVVKMRTLIGVLQASRLRGMADVLDSTVASRVRKWVEIRKSLVLARADRM